MRSRGTGQLLRHCPLLACLLLLACERQDEKPGAPDGGAGDVQFTVRGRWSDVSQLSFRIDAANAAVPAQVFHSTLLRAMDEWRATGVPIFIEAEAGEESPDITFAWRRRAHGECEPFGVSKAVAHSGPVGKSSFIHFDAGREWSEDGSVGNSLYYAALHELGHVLGLGHSDAQNALLRPDLSAGPAVISSSELAGIHSLYGGWEDGPGDLQIVATDGSLEVLASLRRIAPEGISDFTVFDCDGDGDQEILVWRTDHAGHGALMIYHFSAGPKLERTAGPLYGSVAPMVPNLFLRSDDGERMMLCIYADLQIRVLRFDDHGEPRPRAEGKPLVVTSVLADADGDGVLDRAFRPQGDANRVGDLDGDGRMETILRRK